MNGHIRDGNKKSESKSKFDIIGIHYIVLKSIDLKLDGKGNVLSVKGTYWDYGQTDETKYKSFELSKGQFESALKGIMITNK